MRPYSRLWWASILLSSVATGGASFALLSLFTELPIATIAKISVALIFAGDVVLALIMQAVSPTHVKLGPGERWHVAELPTETGTVIADFRDRQGRVSIRGESWVARQTSGCDGVLAAGDLVSVVDRDGLTLIVAAADR